MCVCVCVCARRYRLCIDNKELGESVCAGIGSEFSHTALCACECAGIV